MLDHILATAQAFEREHGIAPNIIYLNTTHFQVLRDLYPGLFESTPYGEGALAHLGLRLVIVTDGMLVHPRAAYLPGPGLKSHQRLRTNLQPDDCAIP